MDTRAELLIDELATHPREQPLDFAYWRDRFQSLFSEPLDDETRQILLNAYASLLNLMERSLVAQGSDPIPFREARKADWNMLCMQEALQRSGSDQAHPDDLQEIVSREIEAGRMEENSFGELASTASEGLGKTRYQSKPKRGLLRRLLG